GLLLPMGIDRLGRTSLSQLIGNAPANDVAQPAPETSRPPVTLELLNAVGHGNDRLLNNLLRLRLAQARPERNRVDEPPVTIEEIPPPRSTKCSGLRADPCHRTAALLPCAEFR